MESTPAPTPQIFTDVYLSSSSDDDENRGETPSTDDENNGVTSSTDDDEHSGETTQSKFVEDQNRFGESSATCASSLSLHAHPLTQSLRRSPPQPIFTQLRRPDQRDPPRTGVWTVGAKPQ